MNAKTKKLLTFAAVGVGLYMIMKPKAAAAAGAGAGAGSGAGNFDLGDPATWNTFPQEFAPIFQQLRQMNMGDGNGNAGSGTGLPFGAMDPNGFGTGDQWGYGTQQAFQAFNGS